MSYGFRAINDSGQILIADDMKNLFFKGKYTNPADHGSHTTYGGSKAYLYTVELAGGATPVPFVKPVNSTNYYAVVSIDNTIGNTWEIEIAVDGAGASPDLYVFTTQNGVPPPTDTHGMQVFNADGGVAFDSRLKPLVVTGLVTSTTPDTANDNSGSVSQELTAPDRYTNSTLPSGVVQSDCIFLCPSIAQSEKEVYDSSTSGGHCTGGYFYCSYDGDYSCYWCQYGCDYRCTSHAPTVTTETWDWAFYREAIQVNTSAVRHGWLTYSHGQYIEENGVGGGWTCIGSWCIYNEDSFSSSGGQWPYHNETINRESRSIIFAKASDYD